MISAGSKTFRLIVAAPRRACASPMLIGRLLGPLAVAGATLAWNENVLSPAAASPCVPSSKNACAAAPPIGLRSPVTVMPVLAGLAPGVTATVSSVALPASTVLGLAAPAPDGAALFADGVSEKSSTARPSSLPEALKSAQRIQNVAPLGIFRPLMVALIAVRLAARLPSSAPVGVIV